MVKIWNGNLKGVTDTGFEISLVIADEHANLQSQGLVMLEFKLQERCL